MFEFLNSCTIFIKLTNQILIMKKLLSAIIICLSINPLLAQTVYPHQVDGEIYVKFTKAALKEVSNDDPNNIPLSKLH